MICYLYNACVIGLFLHEGLDPAGPAFEGMGPKVCLDPTDAQFVDVLHTAAGGFIGKLLLKQ